MIDVLLITPPKEGEIHDLLVFIAEKHAIEWVPPRRPETTYERNMDANPLKGSSAVAIAPAPQIIVDAQPPVVDTHPVEHSPHVDDLPQPPISPVNDPQYDDLMARLRKLKLDQPTKPDDKKPNEE